MMRYKSYAQTGLTHVLDYSFRNPCCGRVLGGTSIQSMDADWRGGSMQVALVGWDRDRG